MSDIFELAAPLRRESRWLVMPIVKYRIRMPRRTRDANLLAAANGPMIELWEKLLLGMTLVRENAALTAGAGEGRGRSFHSNSVRGNLVFVVRYAPEGSALSRLPIEVLDHIDHIIYQLVCATGSVKEPSHRN
jgi:hypothetical protein